MFDISWHELFLVAVITVIVVGPKEIPRVLRTVTGAMRKIRGMAREFQSSIDELAREAELDDLKKSMTNPDDFDLSKEVENMIDPTGETEDALRDLKSTVETAPTDLGKDLDGDSEKPQDAITPEAIGESYRSAKTPSDSLTPPPDTAAGEVAEQTEPAEGQTPENRSAVSRS